MQTREPNEIGTDLEMAEETDGMEMKRPLRYPRRRGARQRQLAEVEQE
jgi:hypothetical protein